VLKNAIKSILKSNRVKNAIKSVLKSNRVKNAIKNELKILVLKIKKCVLKNAKKLC